MKILLVYEVIPEDTKLYVFDNVNPNSELYRNLQVAHGYYMNAVDEDTPEYEAVDFISKFIDNGHGRLLMASLPSAGPFDAVFITGFVL